MKEKTDTLRQYIAIDLKSFYASWNVSNEDLTHSTRVLSWPIRQERKRLSALPCPRP